MVTRLPRRRQLGRTDDNQIVLFLGGVFLQLLVAAPSAACSFLLSLFALLRRFKAVELFLLARALGFRLCFLVRAPFPRLLLSHQRVLDGEFVDHAHHSVAEGLVLDCVDQDLVKQLLKDLASLLEDLGSSKAESGAFWQLRKFYVFEFVRQSHVKSFKVVVCALVNEFGMLALVARVFAEEFLVLEFYLNMVLTLTQEFLGVVDHLD